MNYHRWQHDYLPRVCSNPTASFDILKIIINSVLYRHGAKFACFDVKKFTLPPRWIDQNMRKSRLAISRLNLWKNITCKPLLIMDGCILDFQWLLWPNPRWKARQRFTAHTHQQIGIIWGCNNPRAMETHLESHPFSPNSLWLWNWICGGETCPPPAPSPTRILLNIYRNMSTPLISTHNLTAISYQQLFFFINLLWSKNIWNIIYCYFLLHT